VSGWSVLGLFLVSGLAAGFAFQRSRLCFVSGLRDCSLFGDTAMTRAILVLLAVTAALGALAVQWRQTAGLALPSALGPSPTDLLLGGGLFGVGMVLTGSCAAGAFWRLGEGQLSQLWILGGMWLGIWGYVLLPVGAAPRWYPALPLWLAPVLLALALLGLLLWERRRPHDGEELPPLRTGRSLRRPWAPEVGAVVIAAILAGFLAVTGATWRLTRLFQFDDLAGALFALGLVGGGYAAARFGREWRLRPAGDWRQRSLRLAGGVLMGYGGKLGWGCTIGALLGGAAAGAAQAWLWLAGAVAGAWLGAQVLRRLIW